MPRLLLFALTALLFVRCAGADEGLGGAGAALPPEAFGMFENTNDPAFQKRLDMMSNAVSYSMRVMLAGARGGPLLCRAEVSNGLRPKMALNLDCAGTPIPFGWSSVRTGKTGS